MSISCPRLACVFKHIRGMYTLEGRYEFSIGPHEHNAFRVHKNSSTMLMRPIARISSGAGARVWPASRYGTTHRAACICYSAAAEAARAGPGADALVNPLPIAQCLRQINDFTGRMRRGQTKDDIFMYRIPHNTKQRHYINPKLHLNSEF